LIAFTDTDATGGEGSSAALNQRIGGWKSGAVLRAWLLMRPAQAPGSFSLLFGLAASCSKNGVEFFVAFVLGGGPTPRHPMRLFRLLVSVCRRSG
jgi:hypothetical protein